MFFQLYEQDSCTEAKVENFYMNSDSVRYPYYVQDSVINPTLFPELRLNALDESESTTSEQSGDESADDGVTDNDENSGKRVNTSTKINALFHQAKPLLFVFFM